LGTQVRILSRFILWIERAEIYLQISRCIAPRTHAFPENTEIKISFIPDLDSYNESDEFRVFAGIAYDILPIPRISEKPGTLTLTYDDSILVNVTDEKRLSLFRYNDIENDWILIGGSVDVSHNQITTAITQLGRYGLFENLQDGAKHSLSEIDCQPRVISPRGGGFINTETNISFNLGKASNVTIKIYNTAGRLIRVLKQNEPMTHGIKVIDWDGREQQGNFCETGLYIVAIQTENKMESKTVVVLNRN